MQQFDVVVIGAGSGGLTSAVGFAKVGKRVLLVEREHMGGECTNTGCVPSKALLHHAKTYYDATRVAGKSTKAEKYRRKAFSYVRGKIDSILEEETPDVFETIGITVVLGEARFTAKCTIEVDGTTYRYKKAVIATGSSPRIIEVPGLATADILTNQNIFNQEDVPERLLVIGGGPIGMEMAQAFAMLGSQVTIAERGDEFGRLEDPAIRPILQSQFEQLGITIETGAQITKVEKGVAHFDQMHGNEVTSSLDVPFDKVLISIGRTPNFPAGLGAASIEHDEHGICVDGQHRTSNKYVYAVGDVAHRLKFTHVADDVARQVVTREVSRGWLRVNNRKAVPKVTYTKPEVAQVGLSYEAAMQKYSEHEVLRLEVPYSQNDRAKTDDATDGLMVVVVRRLNGSILGANIIGPAAGELISIFTLAIDQKISMWKLRRTIYAYPTYSLLIKKAGDQFFAQQIGNLKTDLLAMLKKHALKIGVGIAWLTALYFLYEYQSSHDMSTTDTALMIFDFVSMTALGPLVYVLFYTLRPITFFPATALTILSGIFFGFFWGTVLTVIAATLSACVAYGVGRFFGSSLKLEDSVFGNWVEALRRNTFEAILTMRLIFMPFDGVSYLAGILRTKFTSFAVGTFLGIPLGTATFVSIGASLDLEEFKMEGLTVNVIEPQFLILSALIFVVSLFLSRVLKRWKAAE